MLAVTIALDLSGLVNLQSLWIDAPPWTAPASYTAYLACISRLSSSSALETFGCRVDAAGVFLLDWRALDAFFASQRFPCLKEFIWDVYGGPLASSHDTHVVENLPLLIKSSNITVTRAQFS